MDQSVRSLLSHLTTEINVERTISASHRNKFLRIVEYASNSALDRYNGFCEYVNVFVVL